MEKLFQSDSSYKRWARKKREKGQDLFEREIKHPHLHGLKGRVQNHLTGFLRLLLTGFILTVQLSLIFMLPFLLRNHTVYFYFILELVSVVGIVMVVNQNHSTSFRLAWVSICLILPIGGFVMYYLWGRSGGNKNKLDRYILQQISYGRQFLFHDSDRTSQFVHKDPVAGRMVKYMENEGFPLTGDNDVKYYSMGEDAMEDIFSAIENAKHFIFIDFFIVAEGALWDKMHELIRRKIQEGVEVKFLYDDFGASIRTSKYFRHILEEEGIEVRVFNPVHKYTSELYMNFRSHQKIVVVDGEYGFTGGFNLADEYANLVNRFGVWKDTGVRVSGEAVWGLTVVFLQMWEACEKSEEHVDYLKYRVMPEQKGDTYCQVISDGPASNPWNPIENVYHQMIMYSDEYLYITTPYLVLEDYMAKALIEAAKRGVDVRIITPGIPDKKTTHLLTEYNYGRLLREGVRIFTYTPGFMHAKMILTEDAVIVGTINMDYRSFYLHYENGIWMHGKEINEAVWTDMMSCMEECDEITYAIWKQRPFHYKIIQPILNLFSTLF